MTTGSWLLLTGLFVTVLGCTASAQVRLGYGVFATGGGMMSNGTYAAAGTMGQSVIGRSVGSTFAASAGFWGDGGVVLDVEEPPAPEIPTAFELKQNYPNPFNPTTVVSYQVPVARNVRLSIYDLLGCEVALLVNEQKAPGSYTARFDASGLATGAYVYRMTAGDFVQTRRMMLVK
jgi:hypothetical protein